MTFRKIIIDTSVRYFAKDNRSHFGQPLPISKYRKKNDPFKKLSHKIQKFFKKQQRELNTLKELWIVSFI